MSILFATSAVAQINESSSLPEIEFSQLSQRDPNPLGEKALAIHPEQWKHAETDHFIYHFVHSYVANPCQWKRSFITASSRKSWSVTSPPATSNRTFTFLSGRRSGSNFRFSET